MSRPSTEHSQEFLTHHEPFGLEHVEHLRHVVDASLSSDGTLVAAAISWRAADDERCAIHIVEVSSSERLATFGGDGWDDAPSWSPRASRLAFVSDRGGGVPQLHVADVRGNEIRQLTDEPRGVFGVPQWSPDGERIALVVHAGLPADPSLPRRITRAAWRIDGVGVVDDQLTCVLIVDVGSATTNRLGVDDVLARPLAWAPEGDRLLAAVSMQPSAAPGDLREELYELALDGAARRLDVPPAKGFIASYLDGGAIAYTYLLHSGPDPGAQSHLWVLRADGTRDKRSEGLPFDVVGDVITDVPGRIVAGSDELLVDGGDAIVRTQRGGVLGVARIALAGPVAAQAIAPDDLSCAYPLDLRLGRLLVATSSVNEPAGLIVTDLGSGDSWTITVEEDGQDFRFSAPRVDRTGGPCDTWFMHPTTGDAPPHPTVLVVHGGPFSAFGETFFPTAQLLCGAGFAVLFANPPGSRGYGDEFSRATYRDWGGADADVLLTAVEAVVQEGLADRSRLGITGLSYGGYMTCLLAARTNVFAAAVAENPVIDLLSEEGTSDVGVAMVAGFLGDGDGVVGAEQYRRSSPISYAADCRTPTLLILGLDDVRCPPTQGFQFHTALRKAGCESEMLLLPGASHIGGITGPLAGRRAQEAALVEWFTRHLVVSELRGGPDDRSERP